jgi:acetylornithine deacetylase/succinyl-diaminopimelate desuccinylase-like protein
MTDDPKRDAAIARALAAFDEGAFAARLSDLVAIPSTSQEVAHAPELVRYLRDGLSPWLKSLRFVIALHDNPAPGAGPILLARRIEDPALPTVLSYGHGDTVRGLADQWTEARDPWTLRDEGDRWYGRGAADNKGQHAINLAALESVLAERGGRLGFNLTLLIETGEECGSLGLRDFVAAQSEALAADVFVASDGPRVRADVATIFCGSRGVFTFDLAVRLRPGGVHSGNWGGVVRDPAIILAHALAAICDRNGRILVPDLLPRAIPPGVRAALAGCEPGSEGETATIDPDWGEPGLTPAERVFAWTSFIVLAMVAGRPEAPVNAVAPWARATCQLRYTVDVDPDTFVSVLRRHLDAAGFHDVHIENPGMSMRPSRTDPSHPWVQWVAASIGRTLGRAPQVLPGSGGGVPGDVFIDHLNVPLAWIPHSYNGCKQHGPDEHLLKAPAREGIAMMAGLWWDIGAGSAPWHENGKDGRA